MNKPNVHGGIFSKSGWINETPPIGSPIADLYYSNCFSLLKKANSYAASRGDLTIQQRPGVSVISNA